MYIESEDLDKQLHPIELFDKQLKSEGPVWVRNALPGRWVCEITSSGGKSLGSIRLPRLRHPINLLSLVSRDHLALAHDITKAIQTGALIPVSRMEAEHLLTESAKAESKAALNRVNGSSGEATRTSVNLATSRMPVRPRVMSIITALASDEMPDRKGVEELLANGSEMTLTEVSWALNNLPRKPKTKDSHAWLSQKYKDLAGGTTDRVPSRVVGVGPLPAVEGDVQQLGSQELQVPGVSQLRDTLPEKLKIQRNVADARMNRAAQGVGQEIRTDTLETDDVVYTHIPAGDERPIEGLTSHMSAEQVALAKSGGATSDLRDLDIPGGSFNTLSAEQALVDTSGSEEHDPMQLNITTSAQEGIDDPDLQSPDIAAGRFTR